MKGLRLLKGTALEDVCGAAFDIGIAITMALEWDNTRCVVFGGVLGRSAAFLYLENIDKYVTQYFMNIEGYCMRYRSKLTTRQLDTLEFQASDSIRKSEGHFILNQMTMSKTV